MEKLVYDHYKYLRILHIILSSSSVDGSHQQIKSMKKYFPLLINWNKPKLITKLLLPYTIIIIQEDSVLNTPVYYFHIKYCPKEIKIYEKS